ncbi:uncharacterized protein Z519_00966 [Cladophialophora bantiana CBS 173.52]|uniref:Gfo/Idh/MocA-like oxidoreductase N-terminal domain-containing protein n=1 Tax=Cladophialophora bantiana (strain ATCC 10958 / CBS 173.52 / CDC B-1940 / NIH 8579) TaxID=1442370 RepID=A0A0D2I0P9_CLAB1|nr:uncharacterized protein Z519_00966 [Cladophialophora bantiana CBS 173.52]KIW99303.1 hypothetical protein Z519_00966 [Cladophialophora bantiana CBS 173.52]
MSKPIRVGFIGLSSHENIHLAGAWGKQGHLPYLVHSPDYTITALCNSSLESAKKAAELHGLDISKVRTYGDPESLANDDNVDMVVCSVNVMQHYRLIKPALIAGKMVFCEWPLASNLSQMQELADLAEQKKIRTIVGLQGRTGAYVHAVRKFIGNATGQLGDLLSTSMMIYSFFGGLVIPKEIAYLADIKSGGNIFTITAIHMIDTLTAALGEIETHNILLRNKRPALALTDNAFNVIESSVPNSAPDHVLVHGTLIGDVPFNFQVRGGPQFKDTPAFDWRIYCTRGEIRVSGNEMLWMSGAIKVQVHDFVTNKVEDVDLGQVLEENVKDDVAYKLELKAPADNVARLYEAFAKGKTEKYLDFAQSLKWARFIQEAYTANGM